MLTWKPSGREAGTAMGRRGTYRLASCFSEGATLWTLYCDHDLLKVCESKDEGKELAELHEEGK